MANEMTKLINALIALEIPHEVIPQPAWDNAPQVWYPSYDNCSIDVISHCGSIGGRDGLLEMWDSDDYEPIGCLTACQVLEKILEKNKKKA